MRLTARADYAVRAAAELAAVAPDSMKVEAIAEAQGIPPRFLENILVSLRRAGLAQSRRGADGGYRLARPPSRISVADVIRAADGPLANVQGVRPEDVSYEGNAASLQEVWIAVRASLRSVLEEVTLEDVAGGHLPDVVHQLAERPEAWEAH